MQSGGASSQLAKYLLNQRLEKFNVPSDHPELLPKSKCRLRRSGWDQKFCKLNKFPHDAKKLATDPT
jgi:hypothetical protein